MSTALKPPPELVSSLAYFEIVILYMGAKYIYCLNEGPKVFNVGRIEDIEQRTGLELVQTEGDKILFKIRGVY